MYELRVERKNDLKIDLIESAQCETQKEAKAIEKEMIKRYGMIKHAGHTVNYSELTELFTNF